MERLSVSTMLHDLADSPAPPSSVDILRATALGRRRLRVRRWLLGGSAATGVVAVVAIVSLLVGATPAVGPGPGPAPVGSGGTGELASPVPPMPGAAPEQFDPLVQYAALGWQPDGAVGSSINGGRDWLIVGAEYQGLPTNGDEPAPAGIYLTLVTAGHGIDLFQGDVLVDPAAMLPGAPAEPVNGRRAEWLEGFPLAILRWEYAPGAWAAVEVAENLPGVDTREVARRVAENVQYGVGTRVTLPFATTGVPAQLPVAEVQTSRNKDGWSGWASYGTDRVSGGPWPLSILAAPTDAGAGDGSVIADPNTTVDGHAARTTTFPGGAVLQVFDVGGVYVELTTRSAEATALLPDGLVGLFRATQFFPDPVGWR